ncbi:TPA: hypothetical protein ACVGKW_005065 [Pseudomonas aeruginosa]|uniref:hypothetical protein n=1 Tax=Pseudomonas aeruginosa TaxID=287 RepID=UPI001298701C|nr:hypothetical protein [Pseudomonas aeruginosa]EKW7677727.1 hypothetical protein [Pseudomonas aeruginosa]EKX0143382.1 hypothetical protein [Pseudomonas aeruginosa]EKX2592017.1 hypothetical protein [Pseudomonas aeruginosa]EKY1791107.1 hypothetical protein [Pseudomonas aeruginosa]MBG4377728.1 hypothetical protein [Pseudomonas aeruginosa]
MERYHSTAGDPPRRDADVKRQEAQELNELVQQFLAENSSLKAKAAAPRVEVFHGTR